MGFDLQGFLHHLLTLYPVFLFALTIHEVAHALTAKWAGDLTSTYQNRLSLNPMVHMDPFGTVLVPLLMMAFGGGLFFGWARPVPVDKGFRDLIASCRIVASASRRCCDGE